MLIFKIIYWLGVVGQIIIRTPFALRSRARQKAEQHVSTTENFLLTLLTIGGLVLPGLYSLTSWLSFADFRLSGWLGWAGLVFLAGGLLVFWRAHSDLNANWSPSLELYQEHTLVTGGIYRFIRHPMYASQLLFSIAQLLLLQNWIAGPGSLLVFIPFYLLRSRAEERMMLEKFGESYRRYVQSTGSLFPRLGAGGQ